MRSQHVCVRCTNPARAPCSCMRQLQPVKHGAGPKCAQYTMQEAISRHRIAAQTSMTTSFVFGTAPCNGYAANLPEIVTAFLSRAAAFLLPTFLTCPFDFCAISCRRHRRLRRGGCPVPNRHHQDAAAGSCGRRRPRRPAQAGGRQEPLRGYVLSRFVCVRLRSFAGKVVTQASRRQPIGSGLRALLKQGGRKSPVLWCVTFTTQSFLLTRLKLTDRRKHRSGGSSPRGGADAYEKNLVQVLL